VRCRVATECDGSGGELGAAIERRRRGVGTDLGGLDDETEAGADESWRRSALDYVVVCV
jgi:hypothetical protein